MGSVDMQLEGRAGPLFWHELVSALRGASQKSVHGPGSFQASASRAQDLDVVGRRVG